MNDKMKNNGLGAVPEIYSAICISFNEDAAIDLIIEELNTAEIGMIKMRKPKFEASVVLELAIVYYERFWELDEALTKMFGQVAGRLEQLKNIANKYRGKMYIDIAFYQYGTYPALIFCGENMEKIRFLEADISIDPYSM